MIVKLEICDNKTYLKPPPRYIHSLNIYGRQHVLHKVNDLCRRYKTLKLSRKCHDLDDNNDDDDDHHNDNNDDDKEN